MAYPSLSHGFTLMVYRLPARRIPAAAALSDFRRIPIPRNNVSPNSDEPPRRPAGFRSAFFDGDVMIVDGLPTAETAAPRRPARFSSAFFDGEVMIFDGRVPTQETAAPPTSVHGLSKEAISRFMKTEAAPTDPEELCAVCQDNYRDVNQRVVGVLRCRHRFHADCIGKWLQIKNVCPLCNAVGAV